MQGNAVGRFCYSTEHSSMMNLVSKQSVSSRSPLFNLNSGSTCSLSLDLRKNAEQKRTSEASKRKHCVSPDESDASHQVRVGTSFVFFSFASDASGIFSTVLTFSFVLSFGSSQKKEHLSRASLETQTTGRCTLIHITVGLLSTSSPGSDPRDLPGLFRLNPVVQIPPKERIENEIVTRRIWSPSPGLPLLLSKDTL